VCFSTEKIFLFFQVILVGLSLFLRVLVDGGVGHRRYPSPLTTGSSSSPVGLFRTVCRSAPMQNPFFVPAFLLNPRRRPRSRFLEHLVAVGQTEGPFDLTTTLPCLPFFSFFATFVAPPLAPREQESFFMSRAGQEECGLSAYRRL